MANFNIDYLVVAGGGSGNQAGGGGGAGGYRTSYGTGNISGGNSPVETSITATTGSSYTVTVGGGGAADNTTSADTPTLTAQGTKGNNSIFATITSIGGGCGTYYPASGYLAKNNGGSGGGAVFGTSAGHNQGNTSGTAGQGFGGNGGTLNSATYSGGGGGAGAAGAATTTTGAAGLASSITGASVYRAGGGAPGQWGSGTVLGQHGGGNGGSAVTSGTPNTGGGGGGGGSTGSSQSSLRAAGNGGSGIVILRYATADANYTATGITPTETEDGTDTILSFTTVGTGTITFSTPPPPTSVTKVTTPVTDFNKPATEEGLKIPSGPSSNQPTGVEGMVRNDTTQSSAGSSSAITYYNGTNWRYFENQLNTSFNTVLYTGSTSPHAITGVGFQPDLIWIKNRDTTDSYAIVDSVRGITSPAPYIASDRTDTQLTSTNMPTSVQSDGFTITGNGGRTNTSGEDYVAWCFKAGGAAVSNTNGSITSQVSANNYLGFSIVKYQGNGSSTGATIGHGLDTPPEMIIVKDLDATSDWAVYSSATGNTKKLLLNSANTASISGVWNNTSPTSSVFTVRYSQTNEVNHDFIAYCFASKPYYSKVGSYLGNGNATGPIVTLGFEPAFVMIKGVDQSSDWTMLDNKRDPSNPNSARLDANSTMAEYSAVGLMDFNSDGFQIVTTQASQNASGKTFIYLAFANTI